MYANVTAQGLFGGDAAPAAFGQVVPFPTAGTGEPADPGNGTLVAIPVDFWRSAGFGLLVLVALVVYFDLRVLNS